MYEKTGLLIRKNGVCRFKQILEEDYKNKLITEKQYRYFKHELEEGNLDFNYGLYTAYLIMISEGEV